MSPSSIRSICRISPTGLNGKAARREKWPTGSECGQSLGATEHHEGRRNGSRLVIAWSGIQETSDILKQNVSPLLIKEMEKLREAALRAISPIKPPDSNAQLGKLVWEAQRTEAGRNLPHYYLVYFLLVELLRFPNLGRFEKIAWSVPIDFEGTVYLVDHRKFGVGVFCENPNAQENQAERIVSLISKGVKIADPFFRSLADDAVRQSRVNVKNNSASLFQRYEYLRDKFRAALADATDRKGEVQTHKRADQVSGISNPVEVTEYRFPALKLMQEATWIGIAAIDAFFAWTEHVFIHLAIIQGRIKTGDEVANLIGAEWQEKYKQALDITDKDSKRFYDSLATFRRQIRNYMAHGSFGKQGEAFNFHSGAGAVPVILDEVRGMGRFSVTGEAAFDEEIALSTIEDFIAHLWSGPRQPAWTYIQDACLPLILTLASNGTYTDAMQSVQDMERFAHGLVRGFDNAGNMDW